MDNQAKLIPIDQILVDDDFNCRGSITPIDTDTLAASIKKDGLLQPVVVSTLSFERQAQEGKLYRLIAGFRRTYAHKMLKRSEILAIIRPNMTEVEASLLNLTENTNRRELNILQEARAIQKLRLLGMTQNEIGNQLQKSQAWVQNRLALLDMPEPIQREAAAGVLTQTNLKQILKYKTPEKQLEAAKHIMLLHERGEEVNLPTRAKPKPNEKKARKKNEVLDLIMQLVASVGPCPATRCLAWANGEITDNELTAFLREEYPEWPGFTYTTSND